MSVTPHTKLAGIKCKIFCDEVPKTSKHNARGILSMANSGPNTNASQFFITYAKQPHLNGLYTVFGRVIHGFEVLDLMEKPKLGQETVHLQRDKAQSCNNAC